MIRAHLVSTLTVLTALAVSGCAAEVTEAQDEPASSEPTPAPDTPYEIPRLELRTPPAAANPSVAPSLHLEKIYEFGPFPQPWTLQAEEQE